LERACKKSEEGDFTITIYSKHAYGKNRSARGKIERA